MGNPSIGTNFPVPCIFLLVVAPALVWLTGGVWAADSGCPGDWIPWANSCYLGLDASLTGSWSTALKTCSDRGGYMVVPSSEGENSFLNVSFLDEHGRGFIGFWIHCTDTQHEGTWVCYEGDTTAVSYRKWEPNQPDDKKQTEDQDWAFFITRNYKAGSEIIGFWGDRNAGHSSMFVVCERAREIGCRQATDNPSFCLPVEGGEGRPLLDRCLVGHTLEKQPTPGPMACARRCARHPSCRSFNLKMVGHGPEGAVCELHSAKRDEVSAEYFSETASCTYFDVSCL